MGCGGVQPGGVADATSHTVIGGTIAVANELDAHYAGIQLGGDFGCYDGRFMDWDLAFGGFLGFNQGETSQDIMQGAIATSRVVNDFDQVYGGLYMAAVKDSWNFDLQVRLDNTDYDMSESALAGATIGVNGQSFSSDGMTISAAVSYNIYNEDLDLTFVPTAGFGFTKTKTDTLTFVGGETLATDDHNTKIGFVGLTVARTRVAETGDAATNYFGTITAYGDFSGDTNAIFTDTLATTQTLTTEPLGSFGEVSFGISYIKLLDSPESGGLIRQMNLSARVDARLNSDVESYGLTLNARIAF